MWEWYCEIMKHILKKKLIIVKYITFCYINLLIIVKYYFMVFIFHNNRDYSWGILFIYSRFYSKMSFFQSQSLFQNPVFPNGLFIKCALYWPALPIYL